KPARWNIREQLSRHRAPSRGAAAFRWQRRRNTSCRPRLEAEFTVQRNQIRRIRKAAAIGAIIIVSHAYAEIISEVVTCADSRVSPVSRNGVFEDISRSNVGAIYAEAAADIPIGANVKMPGRAEVPTIDLGVRDLRVGSIW